MRFIKIITRKGSKIDRVLNKAREKEVVSVYRQDIETLVVGVPALSKGSTEVYINKVFNLNSPNTGSVFFYETKFSFYFEIRYNGKSIYLINIIK